MTSLTLSSIYTHFNTLKQKVLGKHCGKRWNCSKSAISPFFQIVFYAICILKFFNSYISVVVCNFFEFGTVSKWCIKPWSHWGNGWIMDKKSFLSVHIYFMFVSYPVNPLLFQWCPFRLFQSFEHVQNFPLYKNGQRCLFDVPLLCGEHQRRWILSPDNQILHILSIFPP